MRLDRLVSQSTDLSRNEARRVIRRGEVRVDGEVVKSFGADVDPKSEIELFGQSIHWQANRYFMLNKPEGVVCATRDNLHTTVGMLLDEPRFEQLHPVGRLDIDTTGLVLLTDDGKWSHTITSPKHQCGKRYRATLAEPLAEDAETKLADGLLLEGEQQPTLPATLERLGEREVRLTIFEGRYHQVKRMFAALGNHVEALHREAIGELALDPELEEGEYRPLTADEVALFR